MSPIDTSLCRAPNALRAYAPQHIDGGRFLQGVARPALAAFWLADDSRYGSTPPRRLGEGPGARLTPGPASTWAAFFPLPAKNKDLGHAVLNRASAAATHRRE